MTFICLKNNKQLNYFLFYHKMLPSLRMKNFVQKKFVQNFMERSWKWGSANEINEVNIQLIFICWKWTKETLDRGVKYVYS